MAPTRNRADLRGRIPSRHPYQVWTLGMLALGGLAAIAYPQPTSISALLPTWQRVTWSALLLTAALIGLAAAWLQDPVTGLLAERAGHAGIAGASVAYAAAIILVVGSVGTLTALLLIGLAVAAIRRVLDITGDLKALEVLAPGPTSARTPPTYPGE